MSDYFISQFSDTAECGLIHYGPRLVLIFSFVKIYSPILSFVYIWLQKLPFTTKISRYNLFIQKF